MPNYTNQGSTAAWGLANTESVFFVESVSQDTGSKTAEIAGIDGSPVTLCLFDTRTTVKVSGYLPTRTVATRIGAILSVANVIATTDQSSNGVVTNISITQSNSSFAKMEVSVLRLADVIF